MLILECTISVTPEVVLLTVGDFSFEIRRDADGINAKEMTRTLPVWVANVARQHLERDIARAAIEDVVKA